MPHALVNGTDLYYERHGSGPPAVFCHGDGRDHRAWAPQVAGLADKFELITYDLHGYGHSASGARGGDAYEMHVEDLRALVETLDLNRPAVVGWSFGGRVAYTLAAEYPDVPGALAVLEPASPDYDVPSLPIRLLLVLVPRVAAVVGWPRLFALWRRLQGLRGDGVPRGETAVEGLGMTKTEYVADSAGRVDTAAYNELLASLRRQRLDPNSSGIDFSQISVPVLAMTGADPADGYVETVTFLVESVEVGRRETIPEAGHAAQIDNPEAFNRTLREFLALRVETTSEQ